MRDRHGGQYFCMPHSSEEYSNNNRRSCAIEWTSNDPRTWWDSGNCFWQMSSSFGCLPRRSAYIRLREGADEPKSESSAITFYCGMRAWRPAGGVRKSTCCRLPPLLCKWPYPGQPTDHKFHCYSCLSIWHAAWNWNHFCITLTAYTSYLMKYVNL